MNRLRYRPDLEGLRAIAILTVVSAHAGVPWLAGGFIGVDVFFVLSGYLITGLLVEEYRANGRIDFPAFYVRRFRRLLPALLVMLAVTGVLGSLLLAPGEQPGQAIAAASSAAWLSNFRFAFSNLGYFSPDAETNLFLHTWSLGVEEQFYLAWPALLALTMGLRARKPNSSIRLRNTMLLVLVASLLACVVLTPQFPHITFYMMPTRAWQFALGALVFLWFGGLAPIAVDTSYVSSADNVSTPLMQGSRLNWVGWTGFSLIAAATIGFNKHMLYPGFWAAVPSAGAALILIAGTGARNGGINALLATQPAQRIGRLSYAWYLWHWPVLLLGKEIFDPVSWKQQLALVATSLVLAALSHRFVEAPMRHGSLAKRSPRAVLVGSVMLMILANALALRWHNAAIDRMTSPEQLRYQQARLDRPLIYNMGCDEGWDSAEVRLCSFGPEHAKHTAVAIGDSIGLQWFPAFSEVFDRPDWRLLVLTKSSCPMVDKPTFNGRIGRQYSECERWRHDALAYLSKLAPDIVIMGSTYSYGFNEAEWIEGTTDVLKSIGTRTGHIFVMRSTPILSFDGPSCLAPRSWLHKALASESRCTAPSSEPRDEAIYGWLKAATSRVSNASVLDFTDVVCPAGRCRAAQGETVVFRDSQHLTAAFARSLAPIVADRVNFEERP